MEDNKAEHTLVLCTLQTKLKALDFRAEDAESQ